MNDGGFAFAQAIFHVALFFVIHGCRTRSGIKTKRNQGRSQKRNATIHPTVRIHTNQTANLLTERSSHETCSAISKPIALPKEL